MPNPANNKLIPSLIELPSLLHAAKTRPNEVMLQSIHGRVTSLIDTILGDVENDQLPSFFLEKTILKVLDKIQVTLHEFKELDTENASGYENLVKRVNDYRLIRCTSAVGSSSPSLDEPAVANSILPDRPTVNDSSGLQAEFERCSLVKKKCLSCFCLFDAETEVKKREPIHLWIALGLVNNGTEMLDELVHLEFIERIIRNNKSCKRYKMNKNVHEMIVKAMKLQISSETSLKIMDQSQQQQQQQQREQKQEQQQIPPQEQQQQQQKTIFQRLGSFMGKSEDDSDGLGTLVLNRSEDTLQALTLQGISKKKNHVKVLHLGNWSDNSKKYIVVEEVEALKGLTKHAGEVSLLSLEGISGIVELPDFVYKLWNLKVLDLKGCPNLEYLSQGFDSMKQLTHLDLSECYLLDHFPKGIASLTELRVLKGFIINPEDLQVGVVDGNGNQNRNRNRNRKQKTPSLSASFSDLKLLQKLIKLTIRTRRANFPTSDDFDTLCAMEMLETLKITWVWNSTDVPISASASDRFPSSLKKLELQATPDSSMLRILSLISNNCTLQKLYIRGCRLWDFGLEKYNFHNVQTVRLRYLPELRIEWEEFRKCFHKLTRLEVFGCPNLLFFPHEKNGVWEKTSTTNVVPKSN